FLEQFAGGGDAAGVDGGVERGVRRRHAAAGEGDEAAEEAQLLGPADGEDLGRAVAAGQEHAGGLGDVTQGGTPSARAGYLASSFAAGGSVPGFDCDSPRWTASSSRSIANGLRM